MASFLAALLSALGVTRASPEVQWTVATGEVDGRPIIVRFRSAPPSNAGNYPELVTIRWSYEIDSSGLPPAALRARMERLEDLLTERVEGAGVAFHTATETGNGTREWQWYARSEGEMIRSLNSALSSEPPFPIDIASEADPKWSAYATLVSQAK